MEKFDSITQARGLGLMIGIEFKCKGKGSINNEII